MLKLTPLTQILDAASRIAARLRPFHAAAGLAALFAMGLCLDLTADAPRGDALAVSQASLPGDAAARELDRVFLGFAPPGARRALPGPDESPLTLMRARVAHAGRPAGAVVPSVPTAHAAPPPDSSPARPPQAASQPQVPIARVVAPLAGQRFGGSWIAPARELAAVSALAAPTSAPARTMPPARDDRESVFAAASPAVLERTTLAPLSLPVRTPDRHPLWRADADRGAAESGVPLELGMREPSAKPAAALRFVADPPGSAADGARPTWAAEPAAPSDVVVAKAVPAALFTPAAAHLPQHVAERFSAHAPLAPQSAAEAPPVLQLVPEPSTSALLVAGLAVLGLRRRRG